MMWDAWSLFFAAFAAVWSVHVGYQINLFFEAGSSRKTVLILQLTIL